MKAVLTGIGYTVGSIRYGGLALPSGIAAYLTRWEWLIWATLVTVGLAVAAELYTSVTQGIAHSQRVRLEAEYINQMINDAVRHANGGWAGLNGSEDSPGEGEGGEGEAPVPARI